MNTVLVPLDGSALAEQSLPYARLLATTLGADMRLLLMPDINGITVCLLSPR